MLQVMRVSIAMLGFLAFTAAAPAADIALQPVVTGLSAPVAITHAGDARLFVAQQGGRIAIFDGTRLLPAPFLDLSSVVSCCGERGLLGLAFHPRYASNGRFFVDYTNKNGDITLARYSVSSDPNRADPASGVVLLTIPHPDFSNHNGGQLQFGPDGYLYVGTGDGGSGGDPNNNAQNPLSLLGKILRLDVDSATPYAIPPSNPFITRISARGEIWAYGLRNPWRFSFDRATGDLWIADVGQGAWEEIDVQPAGSSGGQNYGWRRMEGTHCYNPATNCQDGSLTLPVLEYGHTNGACSVTGGYRYRGLRYPRLSGVYFYGDYCNGVISGATSQNGTFTTRTLASTGMMISTFGEDAAGEIYVADYAKGVVYQIVDPAPLPPRRRAVAH